MAGLFSRLSQRVLAPQGNVQPADVTRAPDFAIATGLPKDTGGTESVAPAPAPAPVAQSATIARQAPKPGSEARTTEPSSVRNSTLKHSEKVEAADSAAMPALPRPTLSARSAATPVESALETEDFIPRRPAAPTDEPADGVRETTRAAQEIVPRLAASLSARRAARLALPARVSESDPASPVIHVTIDRIDVHQPPAPAPAPRAPPSSSRISLGDYLSSARRKP